MQDEILDGNTPEETGSDSSTEEQPTEETTQVEETVEDKEKRESMIPRERFDEVNAKLNAYKELLETRGDEPIVKAQPKAVIKPPEKEIEDVDDIRKLVRDEINMVRRQTASANELMTVMNSNPDFVNYKDQVKQTIQSNPSMSWQDALDLARFRSMPKPSTKKVPVETKIRGNAEGTRQTVKSTDIGKIDPFAKGPDGKYLYKLSELESILPKN